MIRLLLVDDHPVVRAGYQRLLEQEHGLHVVAQAGTVDEALALHRRHEPDLTITDLGLPGSGGLELLRRLRERDERVRVLVFSMHDSEPLVRRALAQGARAYVTKSSAPEDLLEAVRQVMAGRRWLSPPLPAAWLAGGAPSDDGLQALTDREFELFRLLARGHSAADCARSLHLSPKTVSNLQTLIKDKLGIATPAAMVHLALRHGVIAAEAC